MTPKLIAFGALFIAIAITPGFASADASHGLGSCGAGHTAHRRGKPCPEHGTKAEKAGRHAPQAKRSAWDVVQHDPCLSKEYRRFAAKNKNERQRRRFVARLAREGCPHPPRQARYEDHPRPAAEPHARSDHRDDVRRYGDSRYDDDRAEPSRSDEDDDEPHYEIRSPLLDLFRR